MRYRLNDLGQSIELSLSPVTGISAHTKPDRWQVDALPARLALTSRNGCFPSGWVLIQATLRSSGSDWTARLFADTGVPEANMPVFDLPLSAKGILIELIKLPPGTRQLLLQPMNSLGEFNLIGLRIGLVSFFERSLRMLLRVVATLYVYPRQRLRRLGLRLSTPFLNLPQAYRLAGCLRARAPAPKYAEWVARLDDLSVWEQRRIAHDKIHLQKDVAFEVLILSCAEPNDDAFQTTIASLATQFFQPAKVTRLSLNHNATQQHPQVKNKRHIWFFILPEGATLSPHALYWFAYEISRYSNVGWLYCDHGFITLSGERINPMFKPDWSPELLRSTNYIGPAAAVRADFWASAGGLHDTAENVAKHSGLHDVWLRISERLLGHQIRHICAPLVHLPTNLARCFLVDCLPAVERHLARSGVQATVSADQWGHCRLRYALPESRPLVSIIVPTRDRLDHLQPCVEGVLEKSTYRAFELMVVDNQSSDPATMAYLAQIRTCESVRVLRYPHPFNYSAINNFAVRQARGEYLCLLNNDTAVISPDWLEEMLGRLIQPGVGAVGAKLFFADGRVQHAGDTVGPGGCANHLHHLLPGDAPGYMHRAVLAQDMSAVTGACLMTPRSLYLSLGGLNEQDLPVAFNDVDYCLRLRAAGWRVVWTPYAELYHYESVSRGSDETPEKRARADGEVAYMIKHWRHVMQHDPFYNPNLSYTRPDFSLSHAPLVERPWE
jgi:GT2 family glycosyltransferase